MRFIGVTQRVEAVPVGGGATERRDSLDQRWSAFLGAAGCVAIPIPNNPAVALALFRDMPMDGLVLTGGNNLVDYGGDAPERDETERQLLAAAAAWPEPFPIIGACRGMQLIQTTFGVTLETVEGHAVGDQSILINGKETAVNSFHLLGTRETAPELEVWARAPDGVVKAVRHLTRPILGLMWHPERIRPFADRDIALFRDHFAERDSIE